MLNQLTKELLALCLTFFLFAPCVVALNTTPPGQLAPNFHPVRITVDGTNYIDSTHKLPVDATVTVGAVTVSNVSVNGVDGLTVATVTNPFPTSSTMLGAAISATNGFYSNLLQGNAVLSATNGIFTNLLKGNAVLSLTNSLPVQLSVDGTNALSATHPAPVSATAAANALTNPLFVQQTIDGTNAISAAHPMISSLVVGGVAVSGTAPVPISATAAANTAANPITTQTSVAGAVVSATNGGFTNLLQGNTVNSAANPIFTVEGGVANASVTSSATPIQNVSTVITFTAPARDVDIYTSPGASNVNVIFNTSGTPTTASATIYGGSGIHKNFGVAITGITYIGVTASGTINVIAQ